MVQLLAYTFAIYLVNYYKNSILFLKKKKNQVVKIKKIIINKKKILNYLQTQKIFTNNQSISRSIT